MQCEATYTPNQRSVKLDREAAEPNETNAANELDSTPNFCTLTPHDIVNRNIPQYNDITEPELQKDGILGSRIPQFLPPPPT